MNNITSRVAEKSLQNHSHELANTLQAAHI